MLEGEETIMINDWLIGHTKPSREGGRTAKNSYGSKEVQRLVYLINSSYSDDGDLTVGGKGNKRLEMGKYADIVLKRVNEPEVYLYCRIGEVRAHTWI